MNETLRKELAKAVKTGKPVSARTALSILKCPKADLHELFYYASEMKKRWYGRKLNLCSIMNAKSGACSENCAFCAQSARHKTHAEIYGLKSGKEMISAYDDAAKYSVSHFGIVTSGETLSKSGVQVICDAVKKHKMKNLTWCASLGTLDLESLRLLKAAGVKRFHHNLETAESFFAQICTTHTYDARLRTLEAVKKAGLELCCGGILGLGESLKQRVEFAQTLNKVGVDAIPMNFLVPVKGTRLEKSPVMKPLDILRSISMFRMTNPKAEIKVCAGRLHLRDLQSMIFLAGASGMMVGALLTVAGRNPELDIKMLEDLGEM